MAGNAIEDLLESANAVCEALWLPDTSGAVSKAAFLHMPRYHWLGQHHRPSTKHIEDRLSENTF